MKYKEVIARIDQLKKDMTDLQHTIYMLTKKNVEIISEYTDLLKDERCSVMVLLKVYNLFNSELGKLLEGEV